MHLVVHMYIWFCVWQRFKFKYIQDADIFGNWELGLGALALAFYQYITYLSM
jgi:hypothetical protein